MRPLLLGSKSSFMVVPPSNMIMRSQKSWAASFSGHTDRRPTASFGVWKPWHLGKITAICPRTFPANVESGANFSVSTFSTEHAGPVSVFPQNFPQPPWRIPCTPASVHARAILPRNPHFVSKSCVVRPGKTHFYPNIDKQRLIVY